MNAERKYKSDTVKFSEILAITLRISMEKIKELFRRKFKGKNLLNWPAAKELDPKDFEKEFASGYKDALEGYKSILEKKLT